MASGNTEDKTDTFLCMIITVSTVFLINREFTHPLRFSTLHYTTLFYLIGLHRGGRNTGDLFTSSCGRYKPFCVA